MHSYMISNFIFDYFTMNDSQQHCIPLWEYCGLTPIISVTLNEEIWLNISLKQIRSLNWWPAWPYNNLVHNFCMTNTEIVAFKWFFCVFILRYFFFFKWLQWFLFHQILWSRSRLISQSFAIALIYEANNIICKKT